MGQILPVPDPQQFGGTRTDSTGAGREPVHVTSVGFQQSNKILLVFLESGLAAEPMMGQGCGRRRAVGMAAWYSLCRRKQLFLSCWLHFPCSQSLCCSPWIIVICACLGSLRSARGLQFPAWLAQVELKVHSGFFLQMRKSCK